MNIRRFRISDLSSVLHIERASFGREAYSATTFLAHLFRDRKGAFVAEDEQGNVLGYTLVRLSLGWLGPRRGGITSVAVAPAHRRRGIGRALLEHAVQYLRERRVEEADLEVSVTNRAAQSLYEAFGFRRARLLPHYYGADRDGLRMVLDLKGRTASDEETGQPLHESACEASQVGDDAGC